MHNHFHPASLRFIPTDVYTDAFALARDRSNGDEVCNAGVGTDDDNNLSGVFCVSSGEDITI